MIQLKYIKNLQEIENIDNFDLIGSGEIYFEIKRRFKNKIYKKSNVKLLTSLDYLKDFIDKEVKIYVFKDKPSIFEKKPIFVISIPKSGTHFLFEFVNILGYKKGEVLTSQPQNSFWYFLYGYKAHTQCKKFFRDYVYEAPFGARDHPFPKTPVLFIYRHPLDILISEANFYHKKGRPIFYNYFYGLSFEERIDLLIDDYLLGSIRDRIMRFSCWLRFPNVIPISYEELVGENGKGSKELQTKLIWSILLKLQIEGSPKNIIEKLSKAKNTNTFNKGVIGRYKHSLKKEHLDKIKSLKQDFLEIFGYDYENLFSRHIEKFRKRDLVLDEFEQPPYLFEADFANFAIVKDKDKFIAYDKVENKEKFIANSLGELKRKIISFLGKNDD